MTQETTETTDEANTIAKKTLKDFTYTAFAGAAGRKSPLASAIYNELIDSAGYDVPASDYDYPIDALIRDLEDLRSAIHSGAPPIGF